MTYNIIGSGNLAWLMATRLQTAGHTCTGIWSRNIDAATMLAKAFNFPLFNSINEVHDGVDMCILAVSDAAIPVVTRQLAFRTTVLIHNAGSVGLEVLNACALNCAVLWPVFPVLKDSLPVHRNFTCVVDSNNDTAQKVVRELARAVSDQTAAANHQQRLWLHLTSVMSSNFVNFLMTMGTEICEANQLSFSIIQPLIQQTISRGLSGNPADLQTGPARRGDRQTIQSHLDLLASKPDWQRIYEDFSVAIENRYQIKEHKD